MSEEDRIGSVMNMEDSSEKTIHARITYGKEPLKVNIRDEEDESGMYCCNPDCRFYGQKVKIKDDGTLTFYCAYCGSIKLSLEKPSLSREERAIAEKAAKLIARDYGEVIKKLEDE